MNRILFSWTGLLIVVVTLAVCGSAEAGGRHRNRNCVPSGYSANMQSGYSATMQPVYMGASPVQTWPTPAPMAVSGGYGQSGNCNCQNGGYQSRAYKGMFTTLP